jgi:hypothetical protein
MGHLARRLRAETAVTLKWLVAELHLGSWTYVANRLRTVKAADENKPQNELNLV